VFSKKEADEWEGRRKEDGKEEGREELNEEEKTKRGPKKITRHPERHVVSVSSYLIFGYPPPPFFFSLLEVESTPGP
jgi:hypothetical protein